MKIINQENYENFVNKKVYRVEYLFENNVHKQTENLRIGEIVSSEEYKPRKKYNYLLAYRLIPWVLLKTCPGSAVDYFLQNNPDNHIEIQWRKDFSET
jgi:hypothetical protein